MKIGIKFLFGVVVSAALATSALANPITYTMTGVGSGYLDAVAFSGASMTFTGVGDTANTYLYAGNEYQTPLSSVTVQIGAVTAHYNGGGSLLAVYNFSTNAVGFAFQTDLSNYGTIITEVNNTAFIGYMMVTSIGPVGGTGAGSVGSGYFATDQGDLVLYTVDRATFKAETAATPLPAALPLFASGLGAMGLLSWHRKRKGKLTA